MVRALAVLAAACVCAGATASQPTLRFTVFATTTLPLGDVVWTGTRFLVVAERTGEIDASGADGRGLARFASLPAEYEEFRCRLSPGAHGWAAGDLYCHGPHGELWRIAGDGSVTAFATLPDTKLQDGALTFDTSGSFGFALLAASGGSAGSGGALFAVAPDGGVRRVGAYPGPGGAENLAVAPPGFGSAAAELLLAIDARSKGGRLLALSPGGRARQLVRLPYGINPVTPIAAHGPARGAAMPGLYVADTASKKVWFVRAAALAAYAGDVLVGGEKGLARFWVVRPSGSAFTTVRLTTTLDRRGSWNFEGATYVP